MLYIVSIRSTGPPPSTNRPDRDASAKSTINPRTNRVEGDCFVNPLTDPDHDGIENSVGCDNCPRNFNPNQEDSDDDDVGDACDNCVGEPNRLQRNSNAFGQKDSAGLAESLMREPPLIPTDNANTAAWKNLYPGDVCNPHPFTAIEPTTRSATNSSTRTFSQTVRLKCPGVGDSLETNSATPAQANNVILAQSISVAEVFGTTRMAICKCSAGLTDSQCFSQCGRGGVTSLPSGTQWVPATLEEGGVQITNDFVSPNPDLYGLFSSDFPVPPTRVVGDTTPLTPPSNRRLGWRYWSDLSSLSAVALGESTIAKPMVWSWLRNFGATRPLRTAVPTSPGVLRRQDLYRFELKETADAQITTWCDSAFAGVLPRFPQYFPTLDNCHMCGRVATIKGLDPEYDSVPKYVAPHYGVRSLEEVADASVIAYLNDDVGFVVPTDERDVGDTILGAVYKLNDHEILGFISRDGGKFTIREANLPAVGLFSSFGAGVAMSARRNEIMFFDAPSPLDPSKLAVRALHPDTMTEERAEPIAVGPGLAGPVVSAAYRSLDDAYYLLSRGGGHVRLHRLSKSLALQVVVEFPDGEWATHADVAVSSQGVVAVTSRDAASFNAVALGVSTDLVVAPLSWISGAEPLGLGAMPTPEGFMLERAGRPDATVYPFADGTAPGLTYHSVESAGWIDIFQ